MEKYGVMQVFGQKGDGNHVDCSSASGRVAIVSGTDVIRIIGKADRYVKFSNDASTTCATDGTQGMLLKAATEYFLLTNKYKFLVSSTDIVLADDNIVAVSLHSNN